MSNVFVAPKIRIGFQTREDCFTKKLAYIIYYDTAGKIRKEKSWKSWIDDKIPVEEHENTPMEGFTLNRDVKRYSGDWFSSKRTLIRVHDPRGFEFEVTTENLIAILMHTDCSKRSLIGQFVYAWSGQDLVLLPTNSEEYQAAVNYTAGLAKKVKAKELVNGVEYKTKRDGNVIYMGKFNIYTFANDSMKYTYATPSGKRTANKCMVFTDDNGETFFTKKSVDFLSEALSTEPVINYAELVDKFNAKIYAHDIVSFEVEPVEIDDTLVDRYGKGETYKITDEFAYSSYCMGFRRNKYFYQTPGGFIPVIFDPEFSTTRAPEGSKHYWVYKTKSIKLTRAGHPYYDETSPLIKLTEKTIGSEPNPSFKQHFSHDGSGLIKRISVGEAYPKLYDLVVVLDNGNRVKIDSLCQLNFAAQK